MVDSLEAERLVLESWKKERDELDAAIAVLERKISIRSGVALSSMGGGGQIVADEFFRMSTPDAIRKFLKISGKPARATTDIIDGLKSGGLSTNYTNVYTALNRLRVKGDVVKVGENWGLTEWYPPAPTRESKSGTGVFNGSETTIESGEEDSSEVEEQHANTNAASDNEAEKVSRKDIVADFLRKHGPSTRREILAGTDIPEGTFAYCVNDKKRFLKGDDGKWRIVE